MVIDFGTGTLRPVIAGDYPIGTVASYGDQANPRKRYVVTEPAPAGSPWQPVVSETGSKSQISRSCVEGPGGWHLEDCAPLSIAEMAAFLEEAAATRARLEQEEKDRREKEAQDHAQQLAQLRREFPFLELAEASKKSTHALGAANLRRLLRREFPGVKFSVKSDSFSMGCSIDVSWSDGPTHEEVNALAGRFDYGRFDSMTDYSYSEHSAFDQLFGGAKYVSCSREISPENLQSLAAELYPARDPAEMAEGVRKGDGYRDDDIRRLGEEARQRSFFTPPPAKSTPTPPEGQAPGITENTAKVGVEIRFPAKPSEETRAALKAAGWRWSRRSACWYKRAGAGVMEEAAKILA